MILPKRDGVRWQICEWVVESSRIRPAQQPQPVPRSPYNLYHHNSKNNSSSSSRIPNSNSRTSSRTCYLRSLVGIVISALLASITMTLRKFLLLASSRMVHQRQQPRTRACINRQQERVKMLTSVKAAINNKL